MGAARVLLGAVLLFFASGTAKADERLEKKMFLLKRALKKNDCQQALEMSEKLVLEFMWDPDPYWARARSRTCMGELTTAWRDMKLYREKGGNNAGASEIEQELAASLAIYSLEVQPIALEVADDFYDGIRFTKAVGQEVWRDEEGNVEVARLPGSRVIGVTHIDPLVSSWSTELTAIENTRGALVAEPVMQIGELLIEVIPPDVIPHIKFSWKGNDAWSENTEWQSFESGSSGQLRVRVPAGQIAVFAESQNPRVSQNSFLVEVAPGVQTTSSISIAQLPAATLTDRAGVIDAEFDYKLGLPTGLEHSVRAGESLETGAGAATWEVQWELANSGTFIIPMGVSPMPLPSGVIITDLRGNTHTELLDPDVQKRSPEFQFPVDSSLDDSPLFRVQVPDVAPGEVRKVSIPHDVPALTAYQAWQDVTLQHKKGKGRVTKAGVVSGGLAAAGAVQFLRARSIANQAAAITDPEEGVAYAEHVKRANTQGKSGIFLFAGSGVSLGTMAVMLGVQGSLGQQQQATAQQFEQAAQEPFQPVGE